MRANRYLALIALWGCGSPQPSDGGQNDAMDQSRDASMDGTSDAAEVSDGATQDAVFAEMQRLCMLVSMCPLYTQSASGPPLGSLADCMMQMPWLDLYSRVGRSLARIFDCERTSHDCVAFERCYSNNHGPAYCVAHPGRSCDGTQLVSCDTGSQPGYASAVVDCAETGTACRENNGSAACTSRGTCAQASHTSCDGNLLVTCDSASLLETSLDCAAVDPTMQCQQYIGDIANPPGAYCIPSGAICTAPEAHCEQNDVVLCSIDVQNVLFTSARVRCSEEFPEGACVASGHTANCTSTLHECTADRCDGAIATTCFGGRPYSMDCRDIGLPNCALTSGMALCSN